MPNTFASLFRPCPQQAAAAVPLPAIGPSCVLVGASSALLGSEMGPTIDGHDTVIRLNRLPTPEFEADFGSKTDVLWITDALMHKTSFAYMGGASVNCSLGGRDCEALPRLLIGCTNYEKEDCARWSASPHQVYIRRSQFRYDLDHLSHSLVPGAQFVSSGFYSFVVFAALCETLDLVGFGGVATADGHGAHNNVVRHNLIAEHAVMDRVSQGTVSLLPLFSSSTERRLFSHLRRKKGHVKRITMVASPDKQDASCPRVVLLGLLLLAAAASALVGCYWRRGGDASDADEKDTEKSSDESEDTEESSDESEDGGEGGQKSEDGVASEDPVAKDPSCCGWAVQLSILLVFVCAGSARALAGSAMRDLDRNVRFDIAAFEFCAEALKLMVAVGWLLGGGCCRFMSSPSRAWLWEVADISFVGVIFGFLREVDAGVIGFIGEACFLLLANLDIASTAVFMRYLLGRRFDLLQRFAMGALVASAMVERLRPAGLQCVIPVPLLVSGALLSLVRAVSVGFGFVWAEHVFKRVPNIAAGMPLISQNVRMRFMMQVALLSAWGMVLNAASWCFRGKHPFMEGIDGIAWVAIVCAAASGFACLMILYLLDNVARCFAAVGQMLLTVAVSRLLPPQVQEGEFSILSLLSLVLLAVALVAYQQHTSARLFPVLFGVVVLVGVVVTALLYVELKKLIIKG